MWKILRAALVVALVVVVVTAFPTAFSGGPARSPTTTIGSEPASGPAASHGPTPSSSHSTSPAASLSRVQAILNALHAKGVSPTTIHLPNFAGAVSDPAQPVTPSYTQAPAPMGVADIGLENQSGVLVPYELNTTSVAGTVNITNLQSLYVDGDGPDTYGIQLNSVANGVTIFNNSSYEFWSQNYVGYTPSTEQLVFGDEVWNFSNASGWFPASSIYGFSPNGTSSILPYLYQGYGPTITIGYPFTLTLYLNTSTIADRPALYFNYTVSNDTFRQSSSFDYLIFNSSVGPPTQAAPAPYYQADGYNYDPIGLINDMEIDILGNDDGDTTTFLAADATISLEYWDATAGEMREVPSAFNAGQETGETSAGLLVTSSGGASPIGIARAGPGFVGGLWNYSTGSGAVSYTLHLQPANAFLFINVGSGENVPAAQWVPTSASGTTTFYLPTDGTYYFDFLMSDYDPATLAVTVTTVPVTHTVSLVANTTEGVYTPLFALDNAELGAISSSGAGTAGAPYILLANQYGFLAPQFAQWNDYLFPVFPGLLLANTSAWVDVTPPSFEIEIPSWEVATGYIAALGLPPTNDLQLQFYDASNISLVHAAGISGWLSAFLYQYPESSVLVWNCTDVLIASDTFEDQGDALTLYGGTNNTIWGNTFLPAPVAATNPASVDDNGVWVTGINETESGDLIYNNFFEVPVPAVTPTVDPFPCDQYGYCLPLNYTDAWNVSEQPATNYAVVNGWNLTGSIIGTGYQGGNFWSNYGTQANPYGVLPYNDSGFITSGGDYVPLVPSMLFPVTFTETGLAAGTAWNVTALGVTTSSASTTLVLWAPNGTYDFTLPSPAGYQGPTNGSFTVNNASVSIPVSFALLVPVTFWESGLVPGWTWSVSVVEPANESAVQGTSTATSLVLALPGGSSPVAYSGLASAFEFPDVNWSTEVGTAALTVTILFAPANGTLVTQVTPTEATLTVDGQAFALPANGTVSVSLAPGLHAIEVTDAGYLPYFNNVSVTSAQSTSLVVSLTSIPTASAGVSSAAWAAIGLLAALAVVLGLIALAYRSHSRRPPPKPLEPATGLVSPPAAGESGAGPPADRPEK